ncbi:MAG TPA: fused MFS/spermidine synthase [Terriglobia bacterium]|nr:fused MFS/spermidine synthase [Terriglobia bacterium]
MNRTPSRLMLLLAAGSGVAALIYEIVWFQLLELTIGSSAVSLAIILATFMGGTCLGSLLLPRVVSSRLDPLRVYAVIEIGIGILGVLALFLMPLIGAVYTSWSGYGLRGFVLRGMVAAVCLLPPTLLMGATLPTLARRITATPDGVSRLGTYYAANIAGAVAGCLLSGFYLLRVYDITTATVTAAVINAAVAGLALLFAALSKQKREVDDSISDSVAANPSEGSGAVYLTIALSGLCALAAEAVWTRMLGLLLGASVYTLSIILAVFLFGLGVGSSVGSLLCSRLSDPRRALGWCQLLAAAAIAWTAYSLSASLPYWPVDPGISPNIWFNFQLDLARALWALLPPTLLWGASFPLALASVASGARDSGRLWSGVYAANTLGAIIGALGTSLLLIASMGTQRTEQLLIAVSAASGLLLLLPQDRSRWRIAGLGIVVALSSGLLIWNVPPLSRLAVAYGRYSATWAGKSEITSAEEGLNASVAVSSFPNGARTFHVAGKIQASSVPRDMRLQRMLGHLTTLTVAHPRNVLVIGCGAGITAGAVSIDPRVENETIVEIEPLVPKAADMYFNEQNFGVIRNRKVHLQIDDGRHYLLTTKEKFDAITGDPLDPWVKGAANLYTREFFEVARQHLNPGGTITMYIQLFQTSEAAVQSAIATFFEVFPNGTMWGNTYEGMGHDLVLVGQVEPMRIDLDAMDELLAQPDYAHVAESMREIGMNSTMELFATYAGRSSDLVRWLRNAAINRDRNLRMEYLAGIGLNLDDSASIYSDMLAFRRFPSDIFTGSPRRIDQLRLAIGGQRGQSHCCPN